MYKVKPSRKLRRARMKIAFTSLNQIGSIYYLPMNENPKADALHSVVGKENLLQRTQWSRWVKLGRIRTVNLFVEITNTAKIQACLSSLVMCHPYSMKKRMFEMCTSLHR